MTPTAGTAPETIAQRILGALGLAAILVSFIALRLRGKDR